jgi:hypothetical protein
VASRLNTLPAPAGADSRLVGTVMTADNWAPHPAASTGRRRRDRRRNIAGLCAALAASLTRTDTDGLRSRLLDALRRLVPGARAVTIRDWQAGGVRLEPPTQKPLVTFEIPTSDPRRIAVLDVLPGEGRTLDDWDMQTLALSSQIGALVLEIESLRKPPRADALTVTVTRPDGAAPLIGSTVVMQELRRKIERVAATNFTVLIEGGIGPEPHLNLAFYGRLAGEREDGKMERKRHKTSRSCRNLERGRRPKPSTKSDRTASIAGNGAIELHLRSRKSLSHLQFAHSTCSSVGTKQEIGGVSGTISATGCAP